MPRRITGAAFLSLDGVMQAPGGPEEDTTGGFPHGGWLTTMFDEALGHQVDSVFGEGAPPGTFRLVEHRLSADGIAMATYEPAGDVETGSFAMDTPSEQELARREKMKQGRW